MQHEQELRNLPEQHVVQLDVAGRDAEAVAVVYGRDQLLEQRPRPHLRERPTLQQLQNAMVGGVALHVSDITAEAWPGARCAIAMALPSQQRSDGHAAL